MASDSGEMKDTIEIVADVDAADGSSNAVEQHEEDTAIDLTPKTSDVATNTDQVRLQNLFEKIS